MKTFSTNARSTQSRRRFLRAGAALALTGAAGGALPAVGAATQTPQTAASAELEAQRLGWAGVKLVLPPWTLLIDPLVSPVWRDALKHPTITPEISTPQKSVLITHLHNDHFDPTFLQKILADNGNVVCHGEVAAMVAGRGLKVRALKLYEPAMIGDFTVSPVPAVDGTGVDQVSWVVVGGGKRIFHGGDTLWHGYWWQVGKQLGPFDAAFLPINGARFKFLSPHSDVPAVLTPEQAVAAGIVLGARTIVPIHFGVSGSDTYEEVAGAEARTVEIAGARKLPVQVLQPGEWLKWKPAP